MSRHTGRIHLGLACVVLALTAGGIAYASIPDSSSVIHSCYIEESGTLRVIDSEAGEECRSNEQALDWNQTGQAGSSDGWDAQLAGTVRPGGSDVQLSGGVTGLEPGRYLLSGHATWPALDSGSGSAFLFCNLIVSGTDTGGSTTGGFGTASEVGGGTVAMMGAIIVTSGTASVRVECRENAGTTSVPVMGRVHVIQVGTLH